MPIKAKPNQNNGSRELVPSGSHVARCFSMIHIGTITDEYKGQKKEMDKIRISWELPYETRTFDESKGEQPMAIHKEYTLSMYEKANLRKMLESWRGQSFTDDEADDFDITVLLGVPCMLSIVHTISKTGREYADIGGVSRIPKGMTCPDQINPTFEFNYDEKFDPQIVESFPEFIRDKIKSTPEYENRIDQMMSETEIGKMNAAMDQQMDNAVAVEKPPVASLIHKTKDTEAPPEIDDDLPF